MPWAPGRKINARSLSHANQAVVNGNVSNFMSNFWDYAHVWEPRSLNEFNAKLTMYDFVWYTCGRYAAAYPNFAHCVGELAEVTG